MATPEHNGSGEHYAEKGSDHTTNNYDAEKGYDHKDGMGGGEAYTEPMPQQSIVGGVHRDLKQRHIQMIAIGGTIGTGLFVASGGALANGGPVGLLLGYSITGVVVYSMMVALGEMVTLYPVSGAFTHYAARFVDPALGFAVGYNYWYSYAITLPTEITAAAIVVQYWDDTTNIAVYITVFLITICAINFFGVRWYGEAEFWFSAIKVTAIIGLIILGIVLDLGGGPTHDRIGFRYWKNPGAFNQLNGIPGAKGRFLAFWATFTNAAFSFLGTEIVALTAGEANNPRRAMPKAIKRVFYRICLFYIGGVIVIGWLVPFNDDRLLGNTGNAASSPYVIAINNAQIKVLPSIVNAVILVSAYSAGNSDLYASSRTLFGLAMDHKAPALFRYCTKGGLPIWCLIATALFGPLAYLNVGTGSSKVFTWLSNLSTITGLLTWGSINLTYLRFYAGLKHAGIDRKDFAYRAPFQPYFTYFGLFFIILITLFNGFQVFLAGNWDVSSFIAAYITLPIFAFFYLFWKIWKRPAFVRVQDMDFETGRREIDAAADEDEANYQKPHGVVGRIWDWMF